ncbi:MAG: PAS domain S-box protein [Chloroflexota bacterium]|nr:PAS domain S-box protein [Chloroflexota bacterium]
MNGNIVKVLQIMDGLDNAPSVIDMLKNHHGIEYRFDEPKALSMGWKASELENTDVILLDLMELGDCELDAITEIRIHAPQVPLVVLFGADGHGLALEALRRGAQECLVKDKLDGSILSYKLLCAIHREHFNRDIYISESRYRALVENVGDIIFTINLDGALTSISPAFENITGWSSDEWLGQLFYGLVHPDELSSLTEPLNAVWSGQEVRIREMRVLTKSGDYITVELSGRPQVIDGKMVGILGVGRDITERKSMERKIWDNGEKYRAIFNNAQIGLFRIAASDGRLLECNCRMAEILGYHNPDECIAQYNISKHYVDHETREHVLDVLRNMGEVQGYEACILKRDDSPIWVRFSAQLQGTDNDILGVLDDLTDIKKADDALRESEARYRLLANNVSDVIWTMGLDLCYTYISPSVTALRGYTVEEAMGHSLDRVLTPDSLLNAKRALADELANENAGRLAPCKWVKMELEEYCRDGSKIWVETSVVFLRDEEGTPCGILGVSRNISERKECEELLKRNEEYYRALIEHSLEAIVILNPDGSIRYVNPSMEWFTARTMEEYVGKNFIDFLHPDDLIKGGGQLNYMLGFVGESLHSEVQLLHRDASWHTFELVSTNLVNHPAMQCIVVNLRDVTERRRAGQQLQLAEERYRTIFDNSAVGIIVTDRNENILSWNKSAEVLLGMTNSDLNKQHVKILYPVKEWNRMRILHMRSEGEQVQLETKMMNGSGDIIDVDVSLSIIKESNGEAAGTVMVIKDITERKLAEEARKQSERQLRKRNTELRVAWDQLSSLADRLEERVKERTSEIDDLLKQRDEFVSKLGHDLKTPLTPLIGLLPLVEEREKDEKSKEMLRVAISNVTFIRDLVSKTLQHAKLNSPDLVLCMDDVDLTEEVARVLVSRGVGLDEKTIKACNNINQGTVVKADRIRLREVLDNLLTNAIKFTPHGGTVTFEAEKNSEVVAISITDTGIGMTSEQASMVFDEFYKADPSRHDLNSSGLGLSICKRIVEKHGGRIWADSLGRGRGTTMCFTIPVGRNQN